MRVRQICGLWLPLAVSFELMMLEGPAVQGAMGRLPDPKLNLAAWGLTMSLSLLIESPVIMLLATAIALVQDGDSYRALRRFMVTLAVGCTVLTALIAFTPLFDLVAGSLMGQPAPIVLATRPALQIMLLWTAAIAWRRFYQGIMVRSGQTRKVSWGTAIRLTLAVSTASLLAHWGRLTGVQVGACAIMAAVVTEALATTAFALPLIRRDFSDGAVGRRKGRATGNAGMQTPAAHADDFLADDAILQKDYAAPNSDDMLALDAREPATPLTQRAIWKFHAPLAATTLLTLLAQPLTAAALARLPQQIATLAVWPVVSILLLVMRGWGLALQEITVSQGRNPLARPALKRFSWMVGLATSGMTALIAFSPLLDAYLKLLRVPRELYGYAHVGMGVGMLLPLISSLSAWAGGLLVCAGQTQHRYRGMAINLSTHVGLLLLGIIFQWPGMLLAAGAFTCAALGEYLYLARYAKRV